MTTDPVIYREIAVFPMISDGSGSLRLINSARADKQDEIASSYDVVLFVRDAETDEQIEDHPDCIEHDDLSYSAAVSISDELQALHPDAGFEWHGDDPAYFDPALITLTHLLREAIQ